MYLLRYFGFTLLTGVLGASMAILILVLFDVQSPIIGMVLGFVGASLGVISATVYIMTRE